MPPQNDDRLHLLIFDAVTPEVRFEQAGEATHPRRELAVLISICEVFSPAD